MSDVYERCVHCDHLWHGLECIKSKYIDGISEPCACPSQFKDSE